MWRPAGSPVEPTLTPHIQAPARRKRCGHGEWPVSALVTRWNGAQARNRRISPAIRRAARNVRRAGAALMVAVEGDAVQLHPMVDEAEAQPLRDPLLQFFQLVVDELDYLAGLDVDQMVVMRV